MGKCIRPVIFRHDKSKGSWKYKIYSLKRHLARVFGSWVHACSKLVDSPRARLAPCMNSKDCRHTPFMWDYRPHLWKAMICLLALCLASMASVYLSDSQGILWSRNPEASIKLDVLLLSSIHVISLMGLAAMLLQCFVFQFWGYMGGKSRSPCHVLWAIMGEVLNAKREIQNFPLRKLLITSMPL